MTAASQVFNDTSNNNMQASIRVNPNNIRNDNDNVVSGNNNNTDIFDNTSIAPIEKTTTHVIVLVHLESCRF